MCESIDISELYESIEISESDQSTSSIGMDPLTFDFFIDKDKESLVFSNQSVIALFFNCLIKFLWKLAIFKIISIFLQSFPQMHWKGIVAPTLWSIMMVGVKVQIKMAAQNTNRMLHNIYEYID